MATVSPSPSPVASKIMILRHGEKPRTDGPPFGVAEDGTQGDQAGKDLLLVRGRTRAGALAALFGAGHGPVASPALAQPQHLFACKVEDSGSHRPHDTLVPLSRKLGVDIDDRYGQDDYEAMIADAIGRPGVVLICWEHRRIRKITAQIPRRPGEPPDRYRWPGTRFDVIFVFERDGDQYRFQQVPQLLLDGDSPDPIDVREVTTAVLGDDD
jgi:hypothetical protein